MFVNFLFSVHADHGIRSENSASMRKNGIWKRPSSNSIIGDVVIVRFRKCCPPFIHFAAKLFFKYSKYFPIFFFAARSSSCLVVSVLPRLFLLLKAVWSVFSVCVCVCDRFYVCIFARIYNLDGRFSIWLFVECPRFSQYHQSLQGFWM